MVMMLVMMIVTVVMMVMVMVMVIEPAGAGAERVTQRAILNLRPRGRRALALHVMVMTLLHQPDLGFEPENLRPILAHHADRRRHGAERGMIGAFGLSDTLRLAAFESQNLRAVGAEAAIGHNSVAKLFGDPFREGLENLVMVAEIPGLHKLDLGMRGGHLVGEAVDPVDQDA